MKRKVTVPLGSSRITNDDARTLPLVYGRSEWAVLERARDLSWKPLESNSGTEKEGFEPSMEAFTPITP